MKRITTAYVQETPSYEYDTEDGVGITHSLFVEAVDEEGQVWGHSHNFDLVHDKEAVAALVEKVVAARYINEEFWVAGDVWAAYKVPQTWAEEKAEYFEKEAFSHC